MKKMRAILVKDSVGANITVITEKTVEEIVMELYLQKRWDIVEVTDNSESFKYQVIDGVLLKNDL